MRFKTFIEQYEYIGQCDRVRRKGPENEANWHEMVKRAKPISLTAFLKVADLSRIMDEDETIEDFLTSNPRAKFYSSVWGGLPAVYMESDGFEFIFVRR